MLRWILRVVFVIGVLSGCSTVPQIVTPTADDYSNAIINQDIATLKAYEDGALHQVALRHQGSQPKNINYTRYPLHAAISLDKPKAVKFFLASNYDINQFNDDNFSPLMFAVIKNNLSLVRLLLERGASVNLKTPTNNFVAISRAIYLDTTDVLELLIEYGANVNHQSPGGEPLLIYAMRDYQLDAMKVLLAAGADVSYIGNDGWSVLHQAVDCRQNRGDKNGDIVKLLIEAGADINQQLASGSTPLALAVSHNHLAQVKLLMAAGADPNIENNDGWHPLNRAVIENKPEVVKALLAGGADVNLAKRNGWAPLHWTVNIAKEQQHDGSVLAQLLIDAGANVNARTKTGNTPTKLAAANNRLDELNILLGANADANTANVAGWTPLFSAVDQNNIAMVRALIKGGADVNQAGRFDWVPIHVAVKNHESQNFDGSELIKLLIKAGADVNRANKHGDTPVNLAISNNRLSELNVLLMNNADVNIANNDGWTALINAVSRNNIVGVQRLIKAGADVNIANNNGWTALHSTVNGHENQTFDGSELMTLLIKSGANINSQTNAGDTAVSLAAVNNRLDELTVLLAQNPDINKADNNGVTPLATAVLSNHIELVKALINTGADLDLADKRDWAPIHQTVNSPDNQKFDGTEIAKLLINAGANLELRISNGFSPLMMASYFGRFNEAKLLLDSGVDISVKNEYLNGDTALDYAIKKGHDKIVALISAHTKTTVSK